MLNNKRVLKVPPPPPPPEIPVFIYCLDTVTFDTILMRGDAAGQSAKQRVVFESTVA